MGLPAHTELNGFLFAFASSSYGDFGYGLHNEKKMQYNPVLPFGGSPSGIERKHYCIKHNYPNFRMSDLQPCSRTFEQGPSSFSAEGFCVRTWLWESQSTSENEGPQYWPSTSLLF